MKTNEIFLLVAGILARVVCTCASASSASSSSTSLAQLVEEEMAVYRDFTQVPWWDVVRGAVEGKEGEEMLQKKKTQEDKEQKEGETEEAAGVLKDKDEDDEEEETPEQLASKLRIICQDSASMLLKALHKSIDTVSVVLGEEDEGLLHLAARTNQLNLATHLVAGGVDVKVGDKCGRQAIHYSIATGHGGMTQLLGGRDKEVEKAVTLISQKMRFFTIVKRKGRGQGKEGGGGGGRGVKQMQHAMMAVLKS